MRTEKNANKLKEYNTSRGIERKKALERGDIWVRPTMCMEMHSKYHRNSSKRELRRMKTECRLEKAAFGKGIIYWS